METIKVVTTTGIKDAEVYHTFNFLGERFAVLAASGNITHVKTGLNAQNPTFAPGEVPKSYYTELLKTFAEKITTAHFLATLAAPPTVEQWQEQFDSGKTYEDILNKITWPPPPPKKTPPKKPAKNIKLGEALRQWGIDCINKAIEEFCLAGIVPGICMNTQCNYTTDVEPDQKKGFCELCGTRSVQSVLEFEEMF